MSEFHEAKWVPWVVAVIGLAVLLTGAAVAVDEGEGGGVVALLIIGAALLITPLVIHRLQSLTVGPEGFGIQLSQQIAALGAPQAAGILERSGLATFASSYAFVHEELAASAFRPAKIHLQDRLVEKAAELARNQKFDAGEVRKLFAGGPPMVRVLALGLMEGDSSLGDAPTILSAISQPLSANEQYHGMKLAELMWRNLSPAERQTVIAVVDADPRIEADTDDRAALAVRLKQLPV